MKLFSFKKSLNCYMILIFILIYIPIIFLIVFSFNDSKSYSWSGFTLKWYRYLFNDNMVKKSIINTLIIAVFSSIISCVFSLMACVGAMNLNKREYSFILNLTNMSIINPEIVIGVSLMLFLQKFVLFSRSGILKLIVSHSTFCLPYVFLAILPKLKQITPHIFEAACDLGLSPFKAFLKAVLPELMPGIISGMIIVFTMSIDDFIVSYFVSEDIQTFPVMIYGMLHKSINPEINVASTLIFLTILLILIIMNLKKKDETNFYF